MGHLYGNQSAASWTWQNLTENNRTWGCRFQVSAAGLLSSAGYYRGGAGVGWLRLAIYNSSGTVLWQTSSPVDSGAVGWQWTGIDPPLAVSTGTTYTIAGDLHGSCTIAFNGSPATRVAPPAPFLFDDVPCHQGTPRPVYPTTVNNGLYVSLSVGYETAPPPIPGPGEGDPTTTGDLQSWLSADPDVQTHEADGLPWLTKLSTDALLLGQAAGAIIWNATQEIVEIIPKRGDPEWTNVLKLWQIAGVLTDAEIALWNLFAKRAPDQLTGPTPGGGSAFFGPGGIQVSDAAEQILAASDKLWHRTQTTNWLIPVPGSEWLKADELTYTGPVGWNQEADVYVNRFTSWPATADRQDIGDAIWLPRAGWWAPLTGTIPHERRFMDMDVQLLHNLPLRSSGVLLVPRGGYEGVIEAWIRPDV